MRAVIVRQWGGSDAAVIEELERPQPGPGEILISVKATSINPFDWSIREGYLRDYIGLPFMLGSDVAGVIEAVGEGVEGWEVGTPVYGMKGIRGGAYAEYTTVLPSEIGHKPATLSYAEAAVVPHAALSAWHALYTLGDLREGQRVLIHAAAGGVGHFAVQFAKMSKAYVIGTASANNEAFLRETGVDEFVDYNATPFESLIKEVDLVIDAVGFGTAERSLQVIKRGGMLVCAVTPPPFEAAAELEIGAKYLAGYATSELLDKISELIDAGTVKPYIQQIFSFDQIQQAMQLSQGRHVRGKLAVTIAD
jgi:NADPH:quinone reductase-like Zn-dependent oxidoreductase